MTHTFVELDIFSSVASKHYGRVLTSADSPIRVPVQEAEPWIRGQYALPCGPPVELSDEAHADLQALLEATTAQFLEEYRENGDESGTASASSDVADGIDDEHIGADDADVDRCGNVIGESRALDGP